LVLSPLAASASSIVETFEALGPATGDDVALSNSTLDGVGITYLAGNNKLDLSGSNGNSLYIAQVGSPQTSHGGPASSAYPSGSDTSQASSASNEWFLTDRIRFPNTSTTAFLSYLFIFDQDVQHFGLDLYDWTANSTNFTADLRLYTSQAAAIADSNNFVGSYSQPAATHTGNDGIVHTLSVSGTGRFAALTFSGGGDNGIGVDNLTFVPEPSTLALVLLVGAAGLARRRERRPRRSA
jgi:hypothetical protein